MALKKESTRVILFLPLVGHEIGPLRISLLLAFRYWENGMIHSVFNLNSFEIQSIKCEGIINVILQKGKVYVPNNNVG